jgi:hypothetical protein
MERNLDVHIWIEKTIVNKKTKKNESNRSLGSVLWSPKTGKDGRNTYKNMLLVKPDDVIIHLVNNLHFVGVSLCES